MVTARQRVQETMQEGMPAAAGGRTGREDGAREQRPAKGLNFCFNLITSTKTILK